MKAHRAAFAHLLIQARNKLLTWAAMKLGQNASNTTAFRIKSLDFRTLWASRQLEDTLGWTPLLDPGIGKGPDWLRWGVATGTEPMLDCSGEIRMDGQDAGPVETRTIETNGAVEVAGFAREARV